MLAPQWCALIEEQKPDVLVHLAFVVTHARRGVDAPDQRRGNQEDVLGRQGSWVRQLVVASSASAYGAFVDNRFR